MDLPDQKHILPSHAFVRTAPVTFTKIAHFLKKGGIPHISFNVGEGIFSIFKPMGQSFATVKGTTLANEKAIDQKAKQKGAEVAGASKVSEETFGKTEKTSHLSAENFIELGEIAAIASSVELLIPKEDTTYPIIATFTIGTTGTKIQCGVACQKI